MRHRYIVKRKQNSVVDLVRGAHDAWSGWLCVLLVGLVTGCVAGVIDIGASWMSDLKYGLCPAAFWLNEEQCCWSSNETSYDDKGNCSQVSKLTFCRNVGHSIMSVLNWAVQAYSPKRQACSERGLSSLGY